MQRFINPAVLFLVAAAAFGQAQGPRGPQPGPGGNNGGPNQGPPPVDLKSLGLTEAELAAVQGDLQAFEQFNQERAAEEQKTEEQKRQVLSQETIDRDAFERLVRAGADLQVKRELARIDLTIEWRSAYGLEKARQLERLFQPPQNQGPNGPGNMGGPGPMGGPQPGPKP